MSSNPLSPDQPIRVQTHAADAAQKPDTAEEEPSLTDPKEISGKIKNASNIDWKKVGIRALSLLAGIALGALTGAAIVGVMTTPVGWAIAGGALLLACVAAYAYDGPKELLHALKYAGIGFVIGFGAAAPIGASSSAIAIGGVDEAMALYLGSLFCGYVVGPILLWAALAKDSKPEQK